MSRTKALVLATLAVLAGGIRLAMAEGESRPLIPLRNPKPAPPFEAAGSGVAPEVSLEITVDERGRVAGVRTLEIEPSTPFDAAFERAAREALLEWRYAPALEDGLPVPKTLRWTYQFGELPGEAGDFHRGPWWLLDDPEDLLRRVWAMPDEMRRRKLDEEARKAEAFLHRPNRRRADSPRFVVVSDSDEASVAEAVAGNLEATFNVLDDLLAIAPEPERYKVVVYVYRSRSSFAGLMESIEDYEWVDGYYHPLGLIALHLEMATGEAVLGMLLHEATHAYLDRHVTRPGIPFPRWLNEGFAEYVDNSDIRKGTLVPGRVPRGRFRLAVGRLVRETPGSTLSLADVKRTIRQGNGLSLEQILAAGPDVFYGEKRGLYYPTSWLLVHFLRHGAPSWAEREFRDLVLYIAEGYAAREAIETVYRAPLSALDGEFVRYLETF